MTRITKISYYDSITRNTDKDIMDSVGEKGCWQIGLSVQIFFIMSVLGIHNYSMTFLAPNQDYSCVNSTEETNSSFQYWPNMDFDEHCFRYHHISNSTDLDGSNSSSIQVTRCLAWQYDETLYTSSLISKWNLVCQRRWVVSLMKSIFILGNLVSTVLFGHLADRFGRKPIIISCCVITTFFSFLSAFCTSVSSFIVVRFLLGVGLGGYYNTAFVLLMEIVVPKARAIYGIGSQLGWTLGFVCLPGIALVFRDVFWLQIVLTVPLIIHMTLSDFVPESPRWLLSCGRTEEAQTILLRAAGKNKLPVKEVEKMFQKTVANMKWENQEHDELNNLLQLLKMSSLRNMMIFLFFIWFVISFVYNSLSFPTNVLSGNPFANFALSGAMEFPAYFLSIFIMQAIGRKRSLAIVMIAAGVHYITLNLIPADSPKITLAATLTAKFFITCAYGIIYVFTVELYPTDVRNVGLGVSTIFQAVGSILAPFIKDLGAATDPVLPYLLLGTLSIAGGSLVLFLRETKNLVLLDTLEEAAQEFRKKE